MSAVDLTFTLVGFPPAAFSGTADDFKTFFLQALVASGNNNSIMPGRIGGIDPLENIGPWGPLRSWKGWDFSKSKYFYATIAVGNENNLVFLDGNPTTNRTLLLQDKDGVAAITDDLYIPRQTYPLMSDAVSKVIDWDASDSFYDELARDTIYKMVNSRHGQEIYLAVVNPSTYLVYFEQGIGFMGGVQPLQTKFIASSLTDVTTFSGSKLMISNMAAFLRTEQGLGISTAGNTPIPAATTIAQILSPTHILLSNSAIADGTNVTATIASRPAIGRTDIWVFKNVGGSIYGRVIQGYPGLLRPSGTALPSTIHAVTIPDAPAPEVAMLAAPSFSPQPGHENLTPGDMVINITALDPAVAIRYTTDGSIPTATTGFLIASTAGSYTLSQGDTIEITAIAVAADNSVSAFKRATYSNVYTVPDATKTAPVDNTLTGQSRLDKGSAGGLMPTKIQ